MGKLATNYILIKIYLTACISNNFTVLVSGGVRRQSAHVYCVAIAFKMTEQVEQ